MTPPIKPASRMRRILFGPWMALRTLPVVMQLLIVGTSLTLLGLGGTIYFKERRAEKRRIEVSNHWKFFEESAARLDEEGMKQSLVGLEILSPNDEKVAQRKEALESGKLILNDPVLLQYGMNQALRAGNLELAGQAAQARLLQFENDWQANCIVAQVALQAGKLDEAKQAFSRLSNPFQANPAPGPGSLLFAIQLAVQLKQPTDLLRKYRVERIVPVVKHPLAKQLQPSEQLQLLECYQQSLLQDRTISPSLMTFWGPALDQYRYLIDGADWSSALGIRIAAWGQNQLFILEELQNQNELTASQAEPLQQDLLELIEKSWQQIQKLDPKNPGSYRGLAIVAFQRKDFAKARAILKEGEKNLGPNPELNLMLARIVGQENPVEALELVQKSLDPKTAQPSEWKLLLETALASGRLDIARQAVDQARAKEPDLEWARRWDVRIALAQGNHAAATKAIQPLLPERFKDADVAKLVSLTWGTSGDQVQLKQYLDEAMQPQIQLPVQLVILQSIQQFGQMSELAKYAEQLRQRHPAEPRLWKMVADSQFELSQPSEKHEWDREQARKSVIAYEWLLERNPNDFELAIKLAWLQLHALQAPEAALQSVYRMIQAEKAGQLPAIYLDQLGVILSANRRTEEARRMLESAVKIAPTASAWLHLAEFYVGINLKPEARQALERAGALPRTDRETAELRRLLLSLQGS
jgi:tetratricopeptide (TPR) repeat protein